MARSEISSQAVVDQIDALVDEGVEYLLKDRKRSFECAEEAYELALELEAEGVSHPLGRANAEAILSDQYYLKADYKLALGYGLSAIAQFEELDKLEQLKPLHQSELPRLPELESPHSRSKQLFPIVLGAVGITYHRLGENNLAVEYFYKQKSASESQGDRWTEGRSHIGLAICHYGVGNIDQSRIHNEKALNIFTELGDLERRATVLNNMCNFELLSENISEAIRLGHQAEEIINCSDKTVGVTPVVYANLFKAYLKADNVDLAEEYLNKSASSLNDDELELHTSLFLDKGRFSYHLGNYEEAIDHFQSALNLGREISIHDQVCIAYEGIADSYKALQNWKESIHYREQYFAEKEKALTQKNAIQFEIITAVHQIEQERKDAQILYLKTTELQNQVDAQTQQLRQLTEDLQKALLQAEALSGLKSRVIEVVSHEFRTPLTIINTAASILHTYHEKLTPAQKNKYFTNIKSSTQDLTTFIQEVESIGDINTITISPNIQPESVQTVFERLDQQLKTQFAETDRLHFDSDQANSTTQLHIDTSILNQITINLVRNALQYSQDVVAVQLAETTGQLYINVIDQGIGILPAEQERIFGLLERGSNTPASTSGLGIGLYISNQLAQLIDATLSVHSDGRDQGSCFTISLPLTS